VKVSQIQFEVDVYTKKALVREGELEAAETCEMKGGRDEVSNFKAGIGEAGPRDEDMAIGVLEHALLDVKSAACATAGTDGLAVHRRGSSQRKHRLSNESDGCFIPSADLNSISLYSSCAHDSFPEVWILKP
jgi:hypothetical protein